MRYRLQGSRTSASCQLFVEKRYVAGLVAVEVAVSQNFQAVLRVVDQWFSLVTVRVVFVARIDTKDRKGIISLYERRESDDLDPVAEDETKHWKVRWRFVFAEKITVRESRTAADLMKIYVKDFFLHGPSLEAARDAYPSLEIPDEVPPDLLSHLETQLQVGADDVASLVLGIMKRINEKMKKPEELLKPVKHSQSDSETEVAERKTPDLGDGKGNSSSVGA
ncbi:hypothetical protein PQX77_010923 [Marasmius sp. AFHP31]|nr:hypothetical protein PQX77_010923 [Marasmius sp. AFHP31]